MRSSCFGELHCVIGTRCHVSLGSVVPSVGSTSFRKVGGFASLLDGYSWLCCEDFLVMGVDSF